MSEALVCWKCGASIEYLSLPLARLDECRACAAEQHVCRMCEFFDRSVAKSCREPVAEEVKDKERANFCDYFKPRPDAYEPIESSEADAAKTELEALFGTATETPGSSSDADSAREDLEALFGPPDDAEGDKKDEH